MGTRTSKRNLYKPDVGETGWGDNVNQNFDTLDNMADITNDIYIVNPIEKINGNCEFEDNFIGNMATDWTIVASGLSVNTEISPTGKGVILTFTPTVSHSDCNYKWGGIFIPVSGNTDIDIITAFSTVRSKLSATGSTGKERFGIFFYDSNSDSIVGYASLMISGGTTYMYFGEITQSDCSNFDDSGTIGYPPEWVDFPKYLRVKWHQSTNKLYFQASDTGEIWTTDPDNWGDVDAYIPTISGFTHVGIGVKDDWQDNSEIKMLVKTFRMNCNDILTYEFKE